MSSLYKIGFNPHDRFMTTLDGTLAVVTEEGNVFGADVASRQMQPVFPFTGAKIGFNPQDRFLATIGNTLMIVTREGNVFGSDVVNRQLQPVYQFTGAKIGFNPEDKFLTSVRGALVVVTAEGRVWAADVAREQRVIGPVAEATGARIGFSEQDRFLVALRDRLVVIRRDGRVFASTVKTTATGAFIGIDQDGRGWGAIHKRRLEPVVELTGARIGFNPQDRFMTTVGNTIVVITSEGNVFGTDVSGDHLSDVYQINLPVPMITVGTRTSGRYPELEVDGEDFTGEGMVELTITGFPGWPPLTHQTRAAPDGQIRYFESHQRVTVSRDAALPPVQVTARDETTGRIATGKTSAEPFVSRF